MNLAFDRYYRTKSRRPDISVVTDFQKYRTSPSIDTIGDLLDDLKVSGITATLDRNSPFWFEKPRYINDDMFFCVLEGYVRFKIGGFQYEAKPGDLVHIPHGIIQTFGASRATGSLIVVIHYTAQISDSIALCELLEFPFVFKIGVDSPLCSQMKELARLFTLGPVGCEQSINSLMTLILMSLVREHGEDMDAPSGRERTVQLRRLLPAIRAMRDDIGAVGSVKTLARTCGLSVAQFRRLFQSVFAQSPITRIQNIRIREASRLLHFTDMTIGEICLNIGYENLSHFHRTFKKITGATPRNYREKLARL